nr:DUF397 domain-containing protein [Nocardia jejuensis]
MNSDLSTSSWFKSTASQGTGECVEIAFLTGGMVGVRDSETPDGPALVFTPGEWDVFLGGVGRGGFGGV